LPGTTQRHTSPPWSPLAVVARLTVNGAQTTGVSFPPAGDELRAGDEPNILEFGAPCGAAVALEELAVSAW
jgi:hypothetical protein